MRLYLHTLRSPAHSLHLHMVPRQSKNDESGDECDSDVEIAPAISTLDNGCEMFGGVKAGTVTAASDANGGSKAADISVASNGESGTLFVLLTRTCYETGYSQK